MSTGRFIVFEGGEGTGKSTQAALLADDLGALLTREPGGTGLGSALRALLLGAVEDDQEAQIADRAEALLMAADRAQHVAEILRPTLAAGRDVVCDRYIPSTVAYQGAGRGLDPSELSGMSEWAADGLLPDLVVLLEVPESVAWDRTGGARDRIEAAGRDFHRRVAASFREQAGADGDRWEVIDGTGDVEVVRTRVREAFRRRWPDTRTTPQ